MIQREFWLSYEDIISVISKPTCFTDIKINPNRHEGISILIDEKNFRFTKDTIHINRHVLMQSHIKLHVTSDTYYNLTNFISRTDLDDGDSISAYIKPITNEVVTLHVPLKGIKSIENNLVEIHPYILSVYTRNPKHPNKSE